MQLENLKRAREQSAQIALPISDQELIERYEAVFTAAVNDVLREMGYLYQTLPSAIQGLTMDMRVAGIAFTIKGSKNLRIEDEMPERAKMLDAIAPYSVCVWDTSGDDESAQWGEIMTMASMSRGCRGAIVDGGVRDVDRILKLGFPVFARYRSSNGMLGRFRMIGYQMPIQIGGVNIAPGDVILADIDGAIVVPRALAMEVLEKAEAIRDNEVEIKKMVLSGLKATEIVERGGYF
ncbi:MAG TPA: RraA family protein [Candidatus Ornithocaccomicrobium faecavium]|uniref:Putative 4-hydroxy-4-methyl-2-oxoglutarate aldolase n=1 Tax=Candidatus Ornithocaccomicrobium faecavium TaxID=2840890 RepID=A0A9D1TDF7_9FIRM|nr:RraA family protein [Candidatus Ornithocaccomicrobium faecavium]